MSCVIIVLFGFSFTEHQASNFYSYKLSIFYFLYNSFDIYFHLLKLACKVFIKSRKIRSEILVSERSVSEYARTIISFLDSLYRRFNLFFFFIGKPNSFLLPKKSQNCNVLFLINFYRFKSVLHIYNSLLKDTLSRQSFTNVEA